MLALLLLILVLASADSWVTFPGLYCAGFAFIDTNGLAVYNATWVTGSWATLPAHMLADGSWATIPGLLARGALRLMA